MTNLSDLKDELPDWPDDVLESWLLRHARREGFGWPPPKDLSESQWRYVLVQSLDWWRDIEWSRHEIALEDNELGDDQRVRTSEMFEAYFRGANNAYRTIEDGKARTVQIVSYMAAHGTLPVAPVALLKNDGLDMVDGNHRLLAWKLYPVLAEEGWMGRAATAPVWIGTREGKPVR